MEILIAITITTIVSLLIFWLIVRMLIFGRIKKIISHIKSQQPSTINHQPSINYLKILETEVQEWSEDRMEEIEQLKKLENYRKEFIGNVSHELKTPIFNIQGYISTLLDGGMEDKTINHDYLKRAEKSVDRMIAIVEDLQTITQLEKGELEIEE
ncbi:MAG: histidine kinase dimerization/phospho-acceptor domain-containing protein [Bacteroidota bacterium]